MRGFFRYYFQEMKGNDKDLVVGAEVGVCFGLNAVQLMLSFPNLKLHLVDSYARNDSRVARQFAQYVTDPFKDRVMWHIKTSEEASKSFPDKSLDFVYIDAAHTYDYVMKDIEVWKPKVKDGGLIGGHDYYKGTEKEFKKHYNNQVVEAVRDSFKGQEIRYSFSPGDWWKKV